MRERAAARREEGYTAIRTTKHSVCHSTPEKEAAITFSRLFLQVYVNLSLFEIPENTENPDVLVLFTFPRLSIKHQSVTSATGRKTPSEGEKHKANNVLPKPTRKKSPSGHP